LGRQYVWTDGGLLEARRRKIGLDEVDEALHAPPGLRFERRLDDLLMVMGMTVAGHVVAVVCESTPDPRTYQILRVRLLAGSELDEWRRRVL
jgi:hypothetical protein